MFQKGNTLGRLRKATTAWNTGLTKETSPIIAMTAEKISRSCKGRTSSRKGVKLSDETRSKLSQCKMGRKFPKLSQAKIGSVPWNKGITGYHTSGHPQSYFDSRTRCLTAAWAKLNQHVKPTKPEIELGTIIDEACPREYRYTGNFSFMIGRYCPDYTNVNGQKKVIEMFGNYWHPIDSVQDRIDKFKEFGYECLIIWESQLKEMSRSELVDLVRIFNKGVKENRGVNAD